MSSLILTMHTTADGFVATEDGNTWPAFGWPPEAQELLTDRYRNASAIIYGRKIYEMVVPFWLKVARKGVPKDSGLGDTDHTFSKVFEPIPKYVISHRYSPKEPGVEVISDDLIGRVRAQAIREKDILLLAGGALAGELATAGLIDELFLIVGPVTLGRGRPLLDVNKPIPTPLISAHAIPPKSTVMRYRVASEFPTER